MIRTTVSVEESLLKTLKQRALDENRSLSVIVNELLRKALIIERRSERNAGTADRWKTFACGAPRVDINDRDALYDLMDESE